MNSHIPDVNIIEYGFYEIIFLNAKEGSKHHRLMLDYSFLEE